MKKIVATIALALALFASGTDAQALAGPFGFAKGMTREQIIRLVGKDAIEKSPTGNSDVLTLTSAPTPNKNFQTYVLMISPTAGLVKLIAIGTTVLTGDTGSELMSRYDDTVDALSKKYGEAKKYNSCTGSESECDSARFFMLALSDKNRTVSSFWTLENGRSINGITAIIADVHYASLNAGYVDVGYEFEGFVSYADQKKAKQNDSL